MRELRNTKRRSPFRPNRSTGTDPSGRLPVRAHPPWRAVPRRGRGGFRCRQHGNRGTRPGRRQPRVARRIGGGSVGGGVCGPHVRARDGQPAGRRQLERAIHAVRGWRRCQDRQPRGEQGARAGSGFARNGRVRTAAHVVGVLSTRLSRRLASRLPGAAGSRCAGCRHGRVLRLGAVRATGRRSRQPLPAPGAGSVRPGDDSCMAVPTRRN